MSLPCIHWFIAVISIHSLFSNTISINAHTEDNVLNAYISENNLKGIISFKKGSTEDVVLITGLVKYFGNNDVTTVSWSIKQLPVDYTILESRCTNQILGTIRYDLDLMVGRLKLNENIEFSVANDILSFTGSQGIWQSSIVLELSDGNTACSTIAVSKDTDLKIGTAKFFGPIFGTIHFFWLGITGSQTDSLIITDLYHVHKEKLVNSQHKWGIYATDILETKHDKTKLNCNNLEIAYNGLDDLSSTLGKLNAGKRAAHREPTFAPIDLYQIEHIYYVAIYDDVHKDSFSTCAPISLVPDMILKSKIESHSTKANIMLSQRSPFDPTLVSFDIISPLIKEIGGVRIHELPFIPNYYEYRQSKCFGIKNVFNPTKKGTAEEAAPPGNTTQDMYAIGDLSGKLNYISEPQWDIFLPLWGPHSVLYRTIAIYMNTQSGIEEPWLCEILVPVTSSGIRLPMKSAEVIFQYPISGRVVFKQLGDREYADTVIIVESLLYSDGATEEDSFSHNWTINEKPPGKDYYDWQNRCGSVGSVYNPFKISDSSKHEPVNYFDYSQITRVLRPLSIVARKVRAIEKSREFFIHPNLPLSGLHSIIGKALVIYDENGPRARGNRLACSKIVPVHRRKAVVRDWFGNGDPVSLTGDIEMYQMSEYDAVDVEIDLQGLQNVDDYYIHMMPVNEELEFPCEESALYGVWNPLNVNKSVDNLTIRTHDLFRMGDLSGKYGPWTDMSTVNAVYNDTNLQMFGRYSLLSRSFVIHKKKRRWACATIERGYAPSEARELRAIASFHHPLGYVYGYIRMTQLIHVDGSRSETLIEVNVRYPGDQNRNVTRDHLWLVYVNPVSVDATVGSKLARCTAAGYVYNPNFIQLAAPLNDELYYQECGPDQPYRCYVGDLSGRLGTISVGAEREMFSDRNLHLEGNDSIMGKSIVILDKNRRHDKFSCANIEPDKDIIKYANIRKAPKFVLQQFISDLREILGTPEWMLTVDNRKTKLLHNGACVQIMLHFKGPEASRIELDFSNLMRTGKLAAPTISSPGYVPPNNRKKVLHYQLCPTRESDLKKKTVYTVGSGLKIEVKIFYLISTLLISFKIYY